MKTFCDLVNTPLHDLSIQYISIKGRARHQEGNLTIEHHYNVDIFVVVLDSQLQELNSSFNEQTVELLVLSGQFKIQKRCKNHLGLMIS